MSNNQFNNPQIVDEAHKTCSLCRSFKPFSEFHRDKKNVKGNSVGFYCKDCANQKARDWHNKNKDNPDYTKNKRSRRIQNVYGINLETYQNKLLSQQCKCAICKTDLPMSGGFTHLDHDHLTGKIRDFLCTNCNRGLGHFKDNKDILMEAINYLQAHTENGTQKVDSFL